MKKALRIVKWVSVTLLGLVLLFALTGFIIVRYYEDEVVAYALERVNQNLKTKAHVEKVDLSFWESFPRASLRFEKLYIEETFEEKDTLLYAEELLLAFNLPDLFRGRYTLKKVEVSQAVFMPSVNRKGEDNWHIWKESPDQDSTSRFHLELSDVELNATHITYEDRKSEFFIDFLLDDSNAGGAFMEASYDLDLNIEGVIYSLISGEDEYLSERSLALDGIIHAESEPARYSFDEIALVLDQLPFVINGEYAGGNKARLDLDIRGNDIRLSEILTSLPERYRASTAQYDADGSTDFNLRLSGDPSQPTVQGHFSISKGSMKEPESGTEVEAIDIQADYFRQPGKSDILKISQCSASLGMGQMTLAGSVNNLKRPDVDLSLKLRASLTDVRNFFALDTLEECQGELAIEATIRGELSSDSKLAASDQVRMLGKAEVNNGVFRLKHSNRLFNEVNGTILLNGPDASVQDLRGVVNGSDFFINGTARNLLPFLTTETQDLQLDASLRSSELNFTNLVDSDPGTNTAAYTFILPSRVDFKLNTSIDRFTFKKFEATSIEGIVSCTDGVLRVDPVRLKTSDGELMAQIGVIPSSADRYQIQCRASLTNIDIRKLFTSFGNFGQTFITDQHLRGKASAELTLSAPLTHHLQMIENELTSVVDITITNGELIGLASLQNIADYIRKNKWAAPFVDEDRFAEKLKLVRFSTLSNVIRIENRMITIPAMDISSSAMDITVQGKHTFDNHIDYSIGFNIRDILVKKEKEFDEADDGLGRQIYMYMRGTTENPEFGLDREARKTDRSEQIAAEKQNIKALLKQELGLFRKDASVGAYEEAPTPTGSSTTLEWEEFDQSDEQTEQPPSEKPQQKPTPEEPAKPAKKVPRWLQEKEEEEDEDLAP